MRKPKGLEREGWRFSILPSDVFMSEDLSHADVRVYAYLQWRAGMKEHAWPKVETMAEDLHMSYPAVKLCLKSLVKNNWIRRERQFKGSSTTYIYETQEDCRTANRLADVRIAGEPNVGYQDSRLNKSQLTTVIELAPKPRRERTPLQKELSELQVLFSELAHIEPPKQNDRSAPTLWYQPIRAIQSACNGKSGEVMAKAVMKLRRDGMTIASPKSIEKTCIAIYGELQTAPVSDLKYV